MTTPFGASIPWPLREPGRSSRVLVPALPLPNQARPYPAAAGRTSTRARGNDHAVASWIASSGRSLCEASAAADRRMLGSTSTTTSGLAQILGLTQETVDLVGDQAFVRNPLRGLRARSSNAVSLRSRTNLRSENPDWRAPRSCPSPRISRSRSASSKPSFVSTIASSRSAAPSVNSSRDRDTRRRRTDRRRGLRAHGAGGAVRARTDRPPARS